MNSTSRLFLALIGLNLLWAPVNLFVAIASHHGMSPAAIALSRWTSLGVLIAVLLRTPQFRSFTRTKPVPVPDALRAMVIGAILFAPAHLLYYSALSSSTTSVGTVLNTTAPVWTAIFSLLILHERMTRYRVSATIIGLAGAYIVSVGFRAPDLTQGDVGSNLRYLLGTIIECLGTVLATRILRRSSGMMVFGYQIAGAVITFALAPVVFGGPIAFRWPPAFDFFAFGALAYLVLIAGLVCWGSWNVIVERTPLNLMVLSTLIQPVVGVAMGHYLNGEPIANTLLIGSGLVVAALLVAARDASRAHRDEVGAQEHDRDEKA